ncbi:hypothetical protein S141_3 [Shewanella sp. phage 1/41]|uniref:hypothetical protein n=1 Tax=Shewanella sp. phage 1/41 TaxID=1458861 RepID=UPI0004F6A3C5|nr:hypothetical protein S141_3 [Shewanella sp. phage 1/41]AHK11649.1 hypothetical protein S141_3 [Shewanella sp. phage 1/41]
MSENPFEEKICEGDFYSTKVKEQFKNLEVGQSVKANTMGRSSQKFRSMLTYAAACMGVRFRTKTNSSGDIWVKRVW